MSSSKIKVIYALESCSELQRPMMRKYWVRPSVFLIGPRGRILNSFIITFESMIGNFVVTLECTLLPSMNSRKVYELITKTIPKMLITTFDNEFEVIE